MMKERFNSCFDRISGPTIHLGGHTWSAFQACGLTGLAIAALLTLSLTSYHGLSIFVATGLIVSAVATFFVVVMVTKVVTGEERITYYHHEIAVIVVTTALLVLLREPVLSYLDVVILGLGAFLLCGRIGCLMTGCCHGRPGSWGITYRDEHTAAGFTSYYLGVRLFPVQALESLWVLFVTVTGAAIVVRGDAPGAAFAWYVVMYDLGRWMFEFLRGDPDRPYTWGFSQPQWISLLLTCAVLASELAGALPYHAWHFVAGLGMVVSTLAVALSRRSGRTARRELLHPRHVREVAEAIKLASSGITAAPPVGQWTILPRDRNTNRAMIVACTSLGVQVSADRITSTREDISHYSLSHKAGGMSEETARILAGLILQLKHASGTIELLKGHRGVFHLLIHRAH